jgi:GntR family transcriptional regulator
MHRSALACTRPPGAAGAPAPTVCQMTPGDITRGTDVPVYVQLANILRAAIESGEIPPGRPLPSKTALKQRHGVADHTVRKVVAILGDEGKVHTVQGLGVFVTDPSLWRDPPS